MDMTMILITEGIRSCHGKVRTAIFDYYNEMMYNKGTVVVR